MRPSVPFWQLTRSPIARQVYDAQIPDLTTNTADEGVGTGHSADDWFDDVVGPGTILTAHDRRVCWFTNLDDMHPRMYGLETEYTDASLHLRPDHQYDEVGARTYRRAGEMTIAEVSERTNFWDGERLSMIYELGTPSRHNCIDENASEPAEIATRPEDSDVFAATDTAAFVKEKRL